MTLLFHALFPAEAVHSAAHTGQAALGHLLDHLLHGVKLLEQAVHVHHLQPAAGGDAALAAGAQDLGVLPLLGGHGEDDGLGVGHLLFVDGGALELAAQLTGHHACQLAQISHVPQLLELVVVVLEGEAVLAQLFLQLDGLLLVKGGLGLFNKGEHIAHAQDPGGHPDRMASRILGMGDVLTLIEKAEQQFDQQKAQELAEKLKKNRFTLQDYYDQLVQVKGMGSVEELLGMMPGINAKALEGATINEKALTRTEAIILSMTPQERENPSILNSSRKKRIAAGCGLQEVDVNRLLKEFGMMQQMTKQMSKLTGKRRKGKFGKMPGGFPGLPFK